MSAVIGTPIRYLADNQLECLIIIIIIILMTIVTTVTQMAHGWLLSRLWVPISQVGGLPSLGKPAIPWHQSNGHKGQIL